MLDWKSAARLFISQIIFDLVRVSMLLCIIDLVDVWEWMSKLGLQSWYQDWEWMFGIGCCSCQLCSTPWAVASFLFAFYHVVIMMHYHFSMHLTTSTKQHQNKGRQTPVRYHVVVMMHYFSVCGKLLLPTVRVFRNKVEYYKLHMTFKNVYTINFFCIIQKYMFHTVWKMHITFF